MNFRKTFLLTLLMCFSLSTLSDTFAMDKGKYRGHHYNPNYVRYYPKPDAAPRGPDPRFDPRFGPNYDPGYRAKRDPYYDQPQQGRHPEPWHPAAANYNNLYDKYPCGGQSPYSRYYKQCRAVSPLEHKSPERGAAQSPEESFSSNSSNYWSPPQSESSNDPKANPNPYGPKNYKHGCNDPFIDPVMRAYKNAMGDLDKLGRHFKGYSDSNEGKSLPNYLTVIGQNSNKTSNSDKNTSEPSESDKKVFSQLERILLNKEAQSAMITGEAGSGKTELIKNFVEYLKNKPDHHPLKKFYFLQLDPSTFQTKTSHVGEADDKLNELMKIAKHKNVVIVIDEIHTLKSAGTHSQNSSGFFDKVKPYISSGNLKIIGLTTAEEYNAHFSQDQAIQRRFRKVEKASPPLNEIPELLKKWAAKKGYPLLSNELYQEITNLSCQYGAVGANLSKATALADEFYSHLRQTAANKQGRLEENLKAEVNSLNNDKEHNKKPSQLWKVAAERYQVPEEHFDPSQISERVKHLTEKLNTIEGNKELKESLIREAKIILTRSNDTSKPQVRRALFGPPGTGKTQIAEAYALGMGLPFERIMLSGKENPQDILNEIGNALRKNPFTVILLDEVEKAPITIQNTLLKLFDSNSIEIREKLSMGSEHTVTTKIPTGNASFFLASNAGGSEIKAKHDSEPGKSLSKSDLKKIILATNPLDPIAARSNKFSEPLLDRMKGIHAMVPASKEEIFQILKNAAKKIFAEPQFNSQYQFANDGDLDSYIRELIAAAKVEGLTIREITSQLNEDIRTAISEAAMKSHSNNDGKTKIISVSK